MICASLELIMINCKRRCAPRKRISAFCDKYSKNGKCKSECVVRNAFHLDFNETNIHLHNHCAFRVPSSVARHLALTFTLSKMRKNDEIATTHISSIEVMSNVDTHHKSVRAIAAHTKCANRKTAANYTRLN